MTPGLPHVVADRVPLLDQVDVGTVSRAGPHGRVLLPVTTRPEGGAGQLERRTVGSVVAEVAAVCVVPAQRGALHLGRHPDLYVDHGVETAAVVA